MTSANAEESWSIVERRRDEFFAFADRIRDMPELNFEEYALPPNTLPCWRDRVSAPPPGSPACRPP